VPQRKLTWSDIEDPVERREAKQAYEKLKDRFGTMTEDKYLKDFLDR
jgi:hypothetical protein